MHKSEFNIKTYAKVVLITSIWVNISEVFRYFVFVMPRAKSFWNDLESVADMNFLIFGIWGFWDTILTAMTVFLYWLYTQRFGNNISSVLASAVLAWVFFFVLFWIGTANMGYSDWSIMWITLPLSLIELIIANFIAFKLYNRFQYAKV